MSMPNESAAPTSPSPAPAVDAPGPASTSVAASAQDAAEARGNVLAWRSPRAWITLLSVIVLGFAVDVATKYAAFRSVADQPVVIDREQVLAIMEHTPQAINRLLPQPAPRVQVVPYVLEFTLVLNPGAVFGMGPGMRWFFKLFTIGALGFATYMFVAWSRRRDWMTHTSIGLLVAGGLGNLYDRWVYGCVRDFIHPLPDVRWPFGLQPFGSPELWPYVSNVADKFLILGIAVLFIQIWRDPGHMQPPTSSAGPSAAPPK